MITVYKNFTLLHDNKKYKCALGKNGISLNKIEGDNTTPAGLYSLGAIYYRKDRIKNLRAEKKLNPINKNMFWSDDPKSINYNKLIKLKEKQCEVLFRKDEIYDIFIVINYNIDQIIPNKGSAIFLHIAKKDFTPTKGCIALEENDLKEIISNLKKKEKVYIKDNTYISA